MTQLFSRSIKYMIVIPFLLMVACLDPFQPVPAQTENHRSDEFEFCWGALDAFLIFQESLPLNPYQYSTPQALYASVNEPYTRYISPSEAVTVRQSLTTEQSGGVGIMVDSCAIGYVITRVILNSPASRGGLLKGDTITAINDSILAQHTWISARTILSGAIGDSRIFSIKRDTSIVTITVTLGIYLAPSVYCDSLDTITALIALTGFLNETELPGGSAEEIDSALNQMSWAQNLIIDLRNNTGGYLSQCSKITAHFVPQNTALINSHERAYNSQTNTVLTQDTVWRTTLAGDVSAPNIYILTNHYTASASEVFISCLKDNRSSTTTIGQTSYGKARALLLFDPTPDSGIAIVTYSVMTPLRLAPYDLVGIPPDIAVADSVDAKVVALNHIHGNAAIAKHATSTAASPVSIFPKIPCRDSRQNTLPLLIRD